MPRCQRTFRRLPPEARADSANGSAVWTCPFCADSESYATVTASDLREFTALAEANCRRDFGAPADAHRATLLLLGERPECVLEREDRRYDLYLRRDSDSFQLRLQIGHEIFHRTCSLGRVFHWTHEMLACHAAVRTLDRCGAAEYADRVRAAYRAEAAGMAREALLGSDLRALEAGALAGAGYGRAFVIGEELIAATGWPALCKLARRIRRDGVPDVSGWLEDLPAETRLACAPIVGIMTG
jgi:hypothetical protein